MNFEKWLDTFIEEKNIDPEEYFEITDDNGWNLIPYGCIIEAMKATSPEEQAAIKKTIVQIDFINGDVKHYMRHLAQALV